MCSCRCVGEHADEHDRAGDGQRDAEDDARGGQSQPSGVRDAAPEPRGDGALHERAGNGDAPDGEQFLRWNCRPTPNISRMTPTSASCSARLRVGDEARRVRADEHAREQVADDRRQADALREVAEKERAAQPCGEREDQVVLMHLADRSPNTVDLRQVQKVVTGIKPNHVAGAFFSTLGMNADALEVVRCGALR